jgi:hypothetical protein
MIRLPMEPREGFELRAAGAGLLVAAKRDRIARDVVVAATVEQMAREAGAKVVTADGVAVEDTPEGMLLRGLMDLFAQYERVAARGPPSPSSGHRVSSTRGGRPSASASRTAGSWMTPRNALLSPACRT